MTRVMHSRQKLWLHGVVTRSLYGSRQMEHWRGEVRVGELLGGCAPDGGDATSTGGAVSAAARSRAFSARRSVSAMVSAGSGGAAAGGATVATVGVVDSTSECWRSTRAAAALFSDMP